jgi:RimJ/RimL family protein N-acetyltransferase
MITRIEGSRINLRKIKRSDAEILAARVNDISVARYTYIPHPYGVKDAREFIRNSHRWWRQGKVYGLMIEEPEDGTVIGCVGVESISQKHRNCEIGYWLWKKYRGRGVMSEAVTLALRFAFEELNLVRVHAHVMMGNEASSRVLLKCGFTREGCLRKRIKHRGRWKDMLIYSILRDEWG